MTEKPRDPPRRNKTLSVADALLGALDPVLKKRGFANRDLLAQWPAIAPPPFDRSTIPDRLAWPKASKNAEGAVLYLRCVAGQAVFVQHEAPSIATAVNRYFGYLLVDKVRLSAEPFTPGSGARAQSRRQASAASLARVGAQTGGIDDPDLKKALTALGLALAGRSERKGE